MKRAGDKCERCKTPKGLRRLEVHHRTYERFGNERLEDLEVVCVLCHRMVDIERREEIEQRNYERFEDARFRGWAEKVYGEDWMMLNNEDVIYEEYQAWLERKDFY